MTTIVLADDHQIVRQGVRALLEAEPDFNVVGEASCGLEAISLVERTRPQVLIVDLMLPDLNGIEVTRQVAERFPQTHIVILSMRSAESYVLEALNRGAQAYVLKASSAADLAYAVRETLAGRHYLSPPLSERAIQAYAATAAKAMPDLEDTLTSREREILSLAAQGLTNAEIATRLSISRATVATHRSSLMRKLGLHRQTDLVRYAIQKGIVLANDEG